MQNGNLMKILEIQFHIVAFYWPCYSKATMKMHQKGTQPKKNPQTREQVPKKKSRSRKENQKKMKHI